MFKMFVRNWMAFLKVTQNIQALVFITSLTILSLALSAFAINANEYKTGGILLNSLITWRNNKDFSMYIFLFEYTCFFVGFFNILRIPRITIGFLFAISFMFVFRSIAIYLVPLKPPPGIIVLFDPIIYFFTGKSHIRDLFFSGHIALLIVTVLYQEKAYAQTFILLGVFIVATLLLVQRVHYIIDIVFALPFSLISARLSKFFTARFFPYL